MALNLVRKSAASKSVATQKVTPSATPARRRRDDDEADLPKQPATGAKGGWGEAEATMAGGGYAQTLTLKDGDEVVFRFLEDEPYASFRMHWLDRTKGKRTYACVGDPTLDTSKNGCPFCEIGITYRSESRFNVALLTEADPLVKSFTATPRMFKKIKSFADDKRYKPLSKFFYYLRRSGTGLKTEYSLEVARSVNDIGDLYPELYVPDAAELSKLPLNTLEQANKEFVPLMEMKKAARELLDDADEE